MLTLPLMKEHPVSTMTPGSGPDVLSQGAAKEVVLTAIRSLAPPACVALYGSWGTGKTTLLKSAHDAWQAPSEGQAIWFQPWEHEQRADVISPLLHSIVKAIHRRQLVDKDTLSRAAMRIAKVLLSLTFRVGASSLFRAVGPLSPLSSLTLEEITKRFDDWTEFHNDIEQVKTRFRELVELALKDCPTGKLVIFLDDLDRCLPDTAVALLEGVKLLLCGDIQCRAIFVFALDRQLVGEAIAKRYPGSTLYSGETYLEKIFDMSLEVPPVEVDQIRAFLLNLDPRLAGPVHDAFGPGGGVGMISGVLSESAYANPRVIGRVVNRLALMCLYRGDAIRAMSHQNARRFVAWTAGAERFRTFRHMFLAASPDEIEAFHGLAIGAANQLPLAAQLRAVAQYPGFVTHYQVLGLSALDTTGVLAQRKPGKDVGMSTLRDFDDGLRQIGL